MGGAEAVGFEDKAKNKIDEIGGKAKQAIGKATGDESTENEGKSEQVKANLKDAAEKVKDAFREK
jgi:uncharacterized protein YjbJ (UPF0337 family)